eukprot:gene12170-biopygen4317
MFLLVKAPRYLREALRQFFHCTSNPGRRLDSDRIRGGTAEDSVNTSSQPQLSLGSASALSLSSHLGSASAQPQLSALSAPALSPSSQPRLSRGGTAEDSVNTVRGLQSDTPQTTNHKPQTANRKPQTANRE